MRAAVAAAIAAGALAAALGTAGCGTEGATDGRPTIAATTGVLAGITARLAGNAASIEQVVPNGSSPHDFQLSVRGRARIEDSLLLVANGAGLEPGIPFDRIGVPTFIMTENVLDPLEFTDGGTDPHVWMDPTRIAGALPGLAEALAEADPAHAAGYRRRAALFAEELRAVDRRVSRTLAAIPAGDRKLVTSHDALGYFADRYGFEVIATPFSGSGADAQPSAGRIGEVEDAIRASGVPTVFAEAESDPEVLDLIAGDTGVRIVTGLRVESPGETGGYVPMLLHDAGLIATGLAP